MAENKKKGRPVGSTTKKSSMKVINLNKNIENSFIVNADNPYEWVTYGKNNNYPNYLLDLYHNSVIHSACIDFLANAILGQGVDYEAMKTKNIEEIAPNYNDTWEDILYRLSMDLAIFGGYAIQVIKNKDGKTYSFFHQPFSTVRFGKKDENGEIKKAYLCKDWTNTVRNKPLEIDVLNYTDDVNIAKGKPYLLTFTNYNIFDEYYPVPHYISAIEAIQADIALKRYDYNTIQNNFTPSGILTLNQCADDNERNLILKNIEATFSNQENANNLMITFRQSNEDKPVEFTPISANVDGVNLFADNHSRNVDRILSAHRLSKGLIGLPIEDAGFSSEGALLEAQYNLANTLLINGLRKKLINNINLLLGMNGIEVEITLKPLRFALDDYAVSATDKVEVSPLTNPDEAEVAEQ